MGLFYLYLYTCIFFSSISHYLNLYKITYK